MNHLDASNDVVEGRVPTVLCSSPVERLLVVHFGLRQIATGTSAADEASSLEELALPILYEYTTTNRAADCSGHTDEITTTIQNSSIELCNLASALYTLPMSLFPTESEVDNASGYEGCPFDETARIVELENATLLFQPIEDQENEGTESNIVLVIQLSKQRQKTRTRQDSSVSQIRHAAVTPQAVATAFRRHHELFCLLRGGGIHSRLKEEPKDGPRETSSGTSCLYPGMDQLFQLTAKTRKLKDRMERLAKTHGNRRTEEDEATTTGDANEKSMKESEQQLFELNRFKHRLLESLPITLLRQALKVHYDGFLSEWQSTCFVEGGRCMVEWTPSPLPQQLPSEFVSVQDTDKVESLRQAMARFMSEISSTASCPIASVSMFLMDNPTHLWTLDGRTKANYPSGMSGISLLLSYMTQIQARALTTVSNSRSTDKNRSSVGWSIWSIAAGPASPTHSAPNDPSPMNRVERGSFVAPPPLSLFGVGEESIVQVLEFSLSSLELTEIDDEEEESNKALGRHQADPNRFRVWAPTVQGLWDDAKRTSHRMCLYQWDDTLQLLFFLSIPPDSEDQDYFDALLRVLNSFLQSTLLDLFGWDKKDGWLERRTWKEEGQDILMINRTTNQVILCSNKRSSHPRRSKERQTISSSKPNGANNRSTATASPLLPSLHSTQSINMYSQRRHLGGCDIRHELASQVGSLDTLLAVEEAMMELSSCGDDVVDPLRTCKELCTALPRHWVWASRGPLIQSQGQNPSKVDDVELYVILDASLYVTASDMETAVARIRSEFLKPLSGTNEDVPKD